MAKSQLISMCHEVGKHVPHWTQGPGSNISVKEKDILWIKASGFRLDAVSENAGVAGIDYSKMVQQLKMGRDGGWNADIAEEKYAQLIQATAIQDPHLGRPSMEAGFHAILPRQWVAHFHSLTGLLLYHEFLKDPVRVNKWVTSNFGVSFYFVEACQPGWLLSARIIEHTHYPVYVLQNHGVVLQTDESLPQSLNFWSKVEEEFSKEFKYQFTKPINAPTPLRLYFPDTAVFLDRLLKVLIQGENNLCQLKQGSWEIDRDACELWLATEILHSACPKLNELPAEISQRVANLPTEKFRQGQSNKDQLK